MGFPNRYNDTLVPGVVGEKRVNTPTVTLNSIPTNSTTRGYTNHSVYRVLAHVLNATSNKKTPHISRKNTHTDKQIREPDDSVVVSVKLCEASLEATRPSRPPLSSLFPLRAY